MFAGSGTTAVPVSTSPPTLSGNRPDMTLHQWFAGQILMGIMSNPQFAQELEATDAVEMSSKMADLMLAQYGEGSEEVA